MTQNNCGYDLEAWCKSVQPKPEPTPKPKQRLYLPPLMLVIAAVLVFVTIIGFTACKVAKARETAEAELAAAASEASSIVDEANTDANAIVAEAESEASSIKADAESEAASIVAAANAKAKAIEAAAKPKLSGAVSLSAAELDLLYRICNAEAGGHGKKAIQAVCHVILNRLKSDRFPDTISGIVYQKDSGVYQFTPVKNGSVNNPATKAVKAAVDEVVAGKVADPTGGALYFATPEAAARDPWWDTLKFKCHINGTNFYAIS